VSYTISQCLGYRRLDNDTASLSFCNCFYATDDNADKYFILCGSWQYHLWLW